MTSVLLDIWKRNWIPHISRNFFFEAPHFYIWKYKQHGTIVKEEANLPGNFRATISQKWVNRQKEGGSVDIWQAVDFIRWLHFSDRDSTRFTFLTTCTGRIISIIAKQLLYLQRLWSHPPGIPILSQSKTIGQQSATHENLRLNLTHYAILW